MTDLSTSPNDSREYMPVEDALADAECLRRVTRESTTYRGFVRTFVSQAARGGWNVEAFVNPDLCARWARDAAHAAFKAVPGLRVLLLLLAFPFYGV